MPAETRIYAYKNIRVYFYVVFMCVFSSAPAETRCVNKRVYTCINAYSRIFTHRVSKKIATKKQSTNAEYRCRSPERYHESGAGYLGLFHIRRISLLK